MAPPTASTTLAPVFRLGKSTVVPSHAGPGGSVKRRITGSGHMLVDVLRGANGCHEARRSALGR